MLEVLSTVATYDINGMCIVKSMRLIRPFYKESPMTSRSKFYSKKINQWHYMLSAISFLIMALYALKTIYPALDHDSLPCRPRSNHTFVLSPRNLLHAYADIQLLLDAWNAVVIHILYYYTPFNFHRCEGSPYHSPLPAQLVQHNITLTFHLRRGREIHMIFCLLIPETTVAEDRPTQFVKECLEHKECF